MKRILITLAVAAVTVITMQAQEFVAPKQQQRKIQEEEVKVKPPGVSIEGIVAQIFKSKEPLQMINPLAPKKYGNGEQNLSRNLENGRPDGFIVLGIQW